MAFPAPGAVVPTNTRFVLEGVGSEAARVGRLVGQELLLRAADDVVTVRVKPGWSSAMNRTAVVLVPNGRLRPNKTYALMVDSVLPNYAMLDDSGADTLEWNTGDGADTTAPKFLLKPAISEGIWRPDGSRFVKIHTTLDEQSPAYLVVSIRRARGSAAVQTYFVPLNGGEGRLGHDACSGNFSFDEGRAYKATVEVYDAAGNQAEKLPQLEFHAPRKVGP